MSATTLGKWNFVEDEFSMAIICPDKRRLVVGADLEVTGDADLDEAATVLWRTLQSAALAVIGCAPGEPLLRWRHSSSGRELVIGYDGSVEGPDGPFWGAVERAFPGIAQFAVAVV